MWVETPKKKEKGLNLWEIPSPRQVSNCMLFAQDDYYVGRRLKGLPLNVPTKHLEYKLKDKISIT